MSSELSSIEQNPVIFFDGDCAFCNAVVLWVFEKDREQKFSFAPLQGKTYRLLRERFPNAPQDVSTFVLYERSGAKESIATRSTAALRTAVLLGGVWKGVAAVLFVVPTPLRDAVYSAIARWRHRFWKISTCRLPSPAAYKRILS